MSIKLLLFTMAAEIKELMEGKWVVYKMTDFGKYLETLGKIFFLSFFLSFFLFQCRNGMKEV